MSTEILHDGSSPQKVFSASGPHSSAARSAGHRDIAILAIRSGKQGRYQEYTGTLRRRMNGYLSALAEFGIDLDGHRVRLVQCASTARGGRSGFMRVWKSRHRPSGLVAMNDIIAIGALDAARRLGVRVPEDLSIVGFDDIPIASLVWPPLTTVSQPLRRKGKLAAELLVNSIESKVEASHHLLPTRLVVRASVQPPSREEI